MKAIILAGGSGSRLWPLSRDMYPKQLLSFNKESSLLQQTYMRLNSLVSTEEIIAVTNVMHYQDMKLQLNQINKDNIILAEPQGKNTAPAIAAALEYFKQNFADDDVVLIVPSDQLIKNSTASFLS